jgi:hypothetical protein
MSGFVSTYGPFADVESVRSKNRIIIIIFIIIIIIIIGSPGSIVGWGTML